MERKRMKRTSVWGDESGFTLAEVLVAMVIFAITTLGLTIIMVSMIGGNEFADQMTQAIQFAEDKMETLKNECCLVVEPGTETIDGFTRSWDFMDNVPVDGLIKVTVTVSWVDGSDQNHSVYLTSLMLPP